MPGVSRIGVDAAGGTIVGDLAPTVKINGAPVVVKGASISGHGRSPHNGPVMTGSSSTVKAHGIEICREGDEASCGHLATGSSNVNAG